MPKTFYVIREDHTCGKLIIMQCMCMCIITYTVLSTANARVRRFISTKPQSSLKRREDTWKHHLRNVRILFYFIAMSNGPKHPTIVVTSLLHAKALINCIFDTHVSLECTIQFLNTDRTTKMRSVFVFR